VKHEGDKYDIRNVMNERRKAVGFEAAVIIVANLICIFAAAYIVMGYGKAKMTVAAEEYGSRLVQWIERQETVTQDIGDAIAADPSVFDNRDSAVEWLAEMEQTHEDITMCYYVVDPDHVYISNGWIPDNGEDYYDREWYLGAYGSDGVYISKPYTDFASGAYCCTFSVAVRDDNGNLLGTVGVDYFIDKLVEVMSQSVSPDGYTFLVASDGAIMNHPNDEYQIKEDRVTQIKDTVYSNLSYDGKINVIKDYDGRLKVAVALTDETSGFSTVTVRTLYFTFGEIIPMAVILIMTVVVCVSALIIVSNKQLAMYRELNRRTEEALIEAESANAAKTDFISRISHDIRTPIGAILNLTEFAREDIDDRAKISKDIDDIDSSGKFLLSLINDVLDISKVDSGIIELHPSPFDYNDYLNEIKAVMNPMCAEKNITFTVDAKHAGEKYILVDKIRLRQIVLNLLSNSCKYSPENTEITYSSHAEKLDGERLRFTFTIRDQGIGMSEEFQKHMFEDFSQDHQNPLRDAHVQGTGLGLPIVKRLVDLMGGTISVESEIGKGSTFTVSFVFDTVDAAEVKKSESQSSAPLRMYSGQKILVVEDNEINTEIATRIFEGLGISPDTASDGQVGVDKFAASAPGYYRAIFMDLQMPGMNGYEAAQAIRGLSRADAASVPIIAMTADAYEQARQKCAEAGMNDYTTKPLDKNAIAELLNKYLGGPYET